MIFFPECHLFFCGEPPRFWATQAWAGGHAFSFRVQSAAADTPYEFADLIGRANGCASLGSCSRCDDAALCPQPREERMTLWQRHARNSRPAADSRARHSHRQGPAGRVQRHHRCPRRAGRARDDHRRLGGPDGRQRPGSHRGHSHPAARAEPGVRAGRGRVASTYAPPSPRLRRATADKLLPARALVVADPRQPAGDLLPVRAVPQQLAAPAAPPELLAVAERQRRGLAHDGVLGHFG